MYSKIARKPGLHSLEDILHAAREQRRFHALSIEIALGVEQEPDAGGMNRITHHVHQPADVLRHAQAHGHVKHLLGEFDGAFHLGTAARQHDAGRHLLLQAGAAQFIADQTEQLLIARLDDLGERLPGQTPRRPVAHARHFDGLVGICQLRQSAGVLDLDVLGVLRGRAHGHGDVVGHLIAGDRNHRGVANRAAAEHRDVGGAAADVHHAHTEILFILGEHRIARGELFQDDVVDGEAAALHAFDDVLRRAVGAGDDVHLGFEAHARHADRIADAFLAVDDVFLRQHVQDLLIGGDGDRLGRIDHALDIALHHLFVLDGDDAVRIEAAHVTAGDAGVHRVNFAARHQFGFFHGALDGLHGGFDVDYHAFLQAARGMAADADDLERPVGLDFADDGDDLAGADVQAHQ